MFRPTFFKIRYTINQTIIKSGFSSSADQYKAKTGINIVLHNCSQFSKINLFHL